MGVSLIQQRFCKGQDKEETTAELFSVSFALECNQVYRIPSRKTMSPSYRARAYYQMEEIREMQLEARTIVQKMSKGELLEDHECPRGLEAYTPEEWEHKKTLIDTVRQAVLREATRQASEEYYYDHHVQDDVRLALIYRMTGANAASKRAREQAAADAAAVMPDTATASPHKESMRRRMRTHSRPRLERRLRASRKKLQSAS